MTTSQTQPSRFSSLPRRVAVAVVAIPIILWLAVTGGYLFFLFVALLSGLALHEFYALTEAKGAYPLKTFGLVAGFFVNMAFIYERLQVDTFAFFQTRGFHLSLFSQPQFFSVTIIVITLTVILSELFRTRGSPLQNAGATLLGILVIPVGFGTLVLTRELFPYGFPVAKFFANAIPGEVELGQIDRWGGGTVVALLAAIWVCDTAAYFAGLTLGRHKLFARVSPGKTWEGTVAGFLGSVLTFWLARRAGLSYLSTTEALTLGTLVGVFGQLGDLVESRFKRDAGVKDSSAIIPGHGGVYDRFDSLVFVAPIVYLYIDFVVLS